MKIVEFPQLELLAIEILPFDQLYFPCFFLIMIAIPHPPPSPPPSPAPPPLPLPLPPTLAPTLTLGVTLTLVLATPFFQSYPLLKLPSHMRKERLDKRTSWTELCRSRQALSASIYIILLITRKANPIKLTVSYYC